LPSKPSFIRAWHCRRSFAKAETKVVLIWNRTARTEFVLDAIGDENCIHWEHGAAWFDGHERERSRYLSRISLAIANSKAAARVLELRWDYRGEIRVVLNSLRPSLVPEAPVARAFPARSAIRVGVAARLFPVKGVALALHAVKSLVGHSIGVELHIAGAGPLLDDLRALARRLNIDAITRFHGRVDDMSSFYRNVDCLLHPPLTEAFGLVAIEAAAHGCPVIAAAVDGLPEAVTCGVTGFCIAPTLPLAAYAELGGTSTGMPAYVYDPGTDRLREPRLVDPAAMADAIMGLFSSEQGYERMCTAAREHALREFSFDRHVDEVMSVVDEFALR
jgi:glycosyltransferase involved in cell wall biosynthesis